MVKDGEGAEHAVRVVVTGARVFRLPDVGEGLTAEHYNRAGLRMIGAEDAAFRARGRWYELGFRCQVDDDATKAEIRRTYEATGQILDPHTAVGVAAARAARRNPDLPMICLATAHPAKFPDAVQAAAWLDLRRVATPAALVSVSAHKFGGPRGVGALVVRSGTPLRALLPGGGQELGRRSGTTHVAGIVGMAAALSALDRERDEVVRRVSRLRDRLESELSGVPGVVPTVVSSTPRLAGTAHLLIDDVDSEPLLFLLDDAGVAASAGSACASGAAAASHVLAAIGADTAEEGRRRGALRLTLGHDATDGQVERAVEVIAATVERLRAPVRRLTPDQEG